MCGQNFSIPLANYLLDTSSTCLIAVRREKKYSTHLHDKVINQLHRKYLHCTCSDHKLLNDLICLDDNPLEETVPRRLYKAVNE